MLWGIIFGTKTSIVPQLLESHRHIHGGWFFRNVSNRDPYVNCLKIYNMLRGMGIVVSIYVSDANLSISWFKENWTHSMTTGP